MTIEPFQNLILNQLDAALIEGGWGSLGLYFEQAVPTALLASQAEQTGQTIQEVKTEIEEVTENPATSNEEVQDDVVADTTQFTENTTLNNN